MAFVGVPGSVFAISVCSEVFALTKRVAGLEAARGTPPR